MTTSAFARVVCLGAGNPCPCSITARDRYGVRLLAMHRGWWLATAAPAPGESVDDAGYCPDCRKEIERYSAIAVTQDEIRDRGRR